MLNTLSASARPTSLPGRVQILELPALSLWEGFPLAPELLRGTVSDGRRSRLRVFMSMKKIFGLVVGMVFGSAVLFAGEVPVQVEGAWILAVPPGSEETAIFMTVVNPGQKPVRVVGGSLPGADRVTPMLTTKEAGRMGMKDTPFLEIPAGGRAVLRPGGDHLMVYGLKKTLKPGKTAALTLRFESGDSMVLKVPISRTAPK